MIREWASQKKTSGSVLTLKYLTETKHEMIVAGGAGVKWKYHLMDFLGLLFRRWTIFCRSHQVWQYTPAVPALESWKGED